MKSADWVKRDTKFLDGLRGLAAMYVLIGHARWLLWEGFSQGFQSHQTGYTTLERYLIYFMSIFKYGHQAVIFFFILSGFTIHFSEISRHPVTFDPKYYFIKRIVRIFPVFLFSLAVTSLFDYVGCNLFHFSVYKHLTNSAVINSHVPYNSQFWTFVGNVFMMQGIYVPVWGTNGPLWSLCYEWWFYMLYIGLAYLHSYNRALCYGLIIVLASLGIINFFPWLIANIIFKYLIFWWLGCLLADVYLEGKAFFGLLVLTMFTIFIAIIFLIWKEKSKDIIIDYSCALGFFLCILLLLHNTNGWAAYALGRFSWAGKFSYTIYIFHFSFLVFLSGILIKIFDNSLPRSQLFIFIGIICSTIVSYLAFLIVEKPSIALLVKIRSIQLKTG